MFPGKKGGFKDDPAGLKVKLEEKGMLAMGNSGKNTNTSQFFFTLGDVSRLTGKHVGFGKLVDGEQVRVEWHRAGCAHAPTAMIRLTPLPSSTLPALAAGAGADRAVRGRRRRRLWQADVPCGHS